MLGSQNAHPSTEAYISRTQFVSRVVYNKPYCRCVVIFKLNRGLGACLNVYGEPYGLFFSPANRATPSAYHHQKIQRNWRNLCVRDKVESFKVEKCLWSDESKFDILVGNHGRRVLRAKEEGDLPACHQFSSKASISDGMGSISACGMGSLHVSEGAMNAEMYKGLRATYAPLPTTCISAGQ